MFIQARAAHTSTMLIAAPEVAQPLRML
ncbi:unnamed protein product, partial [Rotaria socialis]